jgi:hypothetical protein
MDSAILDRERPRDVQRAILEISPQEQDEFLPDRVRLGDAVRRAVAGELHELHGVANVALPDPQHLRNMTHLTTTRIRRSKVTSGPYSLKYY